MSSVSEYLRSLDIRPSDHSYPYASKVLDRYGEPAFNVLQRIPPDARRRNEGWILNAIDNYGPSVVGEVLDDGVLLDYVHHASKIWEKLKPIVHDTRNQVQFNAVFRGYVQEAGFRGTSELYAGACGLTGYARNLDDGSVEVVVQGPKSKIDVFLGALKQEFSCGYEGEESKIQRRIERFSTS